MSKRKNNELEDDRNLAEHGINDPHYWYSVSDGFRLVLWLRQKYLNYTGFPSYFSTNIKRSCPNDKTCLKLLDL